MQTSKHSHLNEKKAEVTEAPFDNCRTLETEQQVLTVLQSHGLVVGYVVNITEQCYYMVNQDCLEPVWLPS